LIVIDWSQSQLGTLRADAFHRFITSSARARAMAIEDYQRTTMLVPIKPPPEVVTGEYLPPGAPRRNYNRGTWKHGAAVYSDGTTFYTVYSDGTTFYTV
jgi:hypothetical protein